MRIYTKNSHAEKRFSNAGEDVRFVAEADVGNAASMCGFVMEAKV